MNRNSSRQPSATSPGMLPSLDTPRTKPGSTTEDGKAPNIAIQVVSLTPCRRGNLLAFADLKFGKWITVRGFRLVRQPGQTSWVGCPANQADEEDPNRPGEKKRRYWPLVDLPPNWKQSAEQAVLRAWADYEETGFLPQTHIVGGAAER